MYAGLWSPYRLKNFLPAKHKVDCQSLDDWLIKFSPCCPTAGQGLTLFSSFGPIHSFQLTNWLTSLISPIIDYAYVCYSDLGKDLLNKLERLYNSCIRYNFDRLRGIGVRRTPNGITLFFQVGYGIQHINKNKYKSK